MLVHVTATVHSAFLMRLSAGIEGHIGNYHRVIDAYLAGGPPPSLDHVNVNPLDYGALDGTR